MTIKPTKQLTLQLIICGTLLSIASPLMAADATPTRTAKSINFSANAEPEKSNRDENLKQAETDVESELIKVGLRPDSMVRAAQIMSSSTGTADIIIYDVSTALISDLNYDGFYHRFSVSIDADTVYDISYVYAKIYLSYEGGPWNHYTTSNNYHIYSDSETDRFVIETELAEGYPTGYYDIRVELYDADTFTWLDTYGPTESAALISLPLEDSYNDDEYYIDEYAVETEVIVTGHGHGAMSWWLLLVPTLLIVIRKFNNKW